MFAKKQGIFEVQRNFPESYMNPMAPQVFQGKSLNHDFFLLVRDQHYEKAYKLGQVILEQQPGNASVGRFCEFIKSNSSELEKMVEYEREYNDDSEEEEEEYSEQEGESSEQEEQEVSVASSKRSSISSLSSKCSSVSSKSAKNVQVTSAKKMANSSNKENAHKWEHHCKNANCTNKKLHKKHAA